VDTHKVLLRESGVNLTLTIVDTPGFGDAVDNSECWEPVIQYVESQYEAFLDAETRVNRLTLPDTRIHACLYFIAPSGHGLKPLDVEYMQRLHDKVSWSEECTLASLSRPRASVCRIRLLPTPCKWDLGRGRGEPERNWDLYD